MSDAPIVIGAGVAGLAAAVELARAGLRPRLLESRPYVGGRVRSFIHTPSGDEIDNGQHLMMGCYRETFRLLDLIGTRDLVSLQRRLRVDFRDADGRQDRLLASALLPSPLDVLWGMLRLRGLGVRERLGLVRVALAAMRSVDAGTGDDETVAALLGRLGQSARTRHRLWDPIVIATLNTSPDVASARLFLEVMRRAFLGGRDDALLAIPRAGLSRLLEPAVDYIVAHGGQVEPGASVTRIVAEAGGFTVAIKDREPVATSRLVVALPPRAAQTLLGAARADDALELSPIVSLYLWYDRPLEDLPEMTALLGTRVQWVFNRRRMMGEPGNGLLSCTISAADLESAASPADVLAMADAELHAAFAELDGARLVDGLVLKEKHATFRAVPAIASLRPTTRGSLSGLYLAGDWTATGLPATIEGAAQSGFAAAEALLADHTRQRAGARLGGHARPSQS